MDMRSDSHLMSIMRRVRYWISFITAALSFAVGPAFALDASELALVVNRNMPDGLRLAQLYAKVRNVPDNRIIELDLPNTEQMTFEAYERDVVPPIREFLRLNDPQKQVKCLVTFYGVPFRVGSHVNTPEETREIQDLRDQLKAVGDRISALVGESEKLASSYDASFNSASQPAPLVPEQPGALLNGPGLEALARRLDHAGKSIMVDIGAMKDPQQHQQAEDAIISLVRQFNAPVQLHASGSAQGTPPSTATTVPSDPVVAAMPLEDRRFDPAGRQQIRDETAKSAGLLGYAKVLLSQLAYLAPEDTEAATDNELSLLWWTFYPRSKWQLNSLCYRFSPGGSAPALMVARLDGPTPDIVRQMILDSLHAETQGLQGKVVLDARGLSLDGPGGKPDPYAIYDDSLRQLAALIHLKTKMQVTFDDKPDVLPAHTAVDVAVYCGWYSVGKYVPACSFVPGAVGYHMASFEMVSLRDPANNGWVRGLLSDGVAATIGPVSEPYLQAFPLPNEFFPLLLTGRLTLAEVYWKTELMASWRMCLVGDPLYTPFKQDPQLKIDDLSPRLQTIFEPKTARLAVPSSKP
jgi:uncharacterized protein (TIGR03790 family)